LIYEVSLTVNGTYVIRERESIPVEEIQKQEEEILYWGGFSAGGNSILTLKRGEMGCCGTFSPWGNSIPSPFFQRERQCGGKVYATTPGQNMSYVSPHEF
jgi:hypothetical protein